MENKKKQQPRSFSRKKNRSVFARNIGYLREAYGLSQMEFAELLVETRPSFAAVSRWEVGDNMPRQDKMNEIATLFNLSVETLTTVDLAKGKD